MTPEQIEAERSRNTENEITENEIIVYVAADPTQPGTAWAACVDDLRFKKDTAKAILREG